MSAILSTVVEIDDNVLGMQWKVDDLTALAKLIALIALGQASHAAEILKEMSIEDVAISHPALFESARNQLKIKGESETQQEVSRYHRDGFLFECISWIVARREADARTLMKDPHLSATTQGLDGLMIKMKPGAPQVDCVTISEDKCTENPRDKFRDEVLITFGDHHRDKRCNELVANAALLIREGVGLNGTDAVKAAAAVLDKSIRSYRAAVTVNNTFDTISKRKKLFKGFESIDGINQSQRIGAMFIIEGKLRDWFQLLADTIVDTLCVLEKADDLDV